MTMQPIASRLEIISRGPPARSPIRRVRQSTSDCVPLALWMQSPMVFFERPIAEIGFTPVAMIEVIEKKVSTDHAAPTRMAMIGPAKRIRSSMPITTPITMVTAHHPSSCGSRTSACAYP